MESEPTELDPTSILFSRIADGQVTQVDGVMSPLTVSLIEKFSAQGVDMTSWWSFTSQGWACPACDRTKRDIARLNARGQLMCRLVEHHDHVRDLLLTRFREISSTRGEVVADSIAEDFAKRSAAMVSSYENTIVCDDCNVADLNGKKAAKAHPDFSYSPGEIRQFAIVTPNAPHGIDAGIAQKLWEQREKTFLLRLKIIERIAEIAANNEHWFQAQPPTAHPAFIEHTARSVLRIYGASGALYSLCGPKRTQPVRAPAAWRSIVRPSVGRAPRQGDIDHIAKVACKYDWDKLPDDWTCPGCQRNKVAIIRPTNDHPWKLLVEERNFWSNGARWNVAKVMACGDCIDTAHNLAKEAAGLCEIKVGAYARWVSIEEVASVVMAQAHSRHRINNSVADNLVVKVAARISDDISDTD